MGKVLSILLVKAAEGDFGPAVKAAYWKTVGYKTYIGLALAVVAYGLNEAAKAGLCAECGTWGAQVAAALAALTIVVGQIDVAVRTTAPNPDEYVKPPSRLG